MKSIESIKKIHHSSMNDFCFVFSDKSSNHQTTFLGNCKPVHFIEIVGADFNNNLNLKFYCFVTGTKFFLIEKNLLISAIRTAQTIDSHHFKNGLAKRTSKRTFPYLTLIFTLSHNFLFAA